ncbi:thermonuclease family protein [Campylobacter sp.]|uniref:thermonuclease family protein n=1 Tax=Campylobacter sp. TaxID=205 RepID=UPI00290C2991|nr:thermonuclease family protein [Campylobacter sp.]MDU6827782.1 thermonuclease family protein [Campylobacter sp.]
MIRLFILLLPLFLFALSGQVVKISDGDTITILTQEKQQVKVRLYGIDAPEKKQPYGQKSKQFLSNLIAGRSVEIQEKGKDRYKRVLGIVYLDGRDINEQMVLNGYAWAYVKYSKIYASQELKARSQNLGLWRDKPIPPWEWRKR